MSTDHSHLVARC